MAATGTIEGNGMRKPRSPIMERRVLEKLMREWVGTLRRMYGDRLTHVLLYGSYARGTATAGSDVDTLAVLRGRADLAREVRLMGAQGRYDLELRYGVHLSGIPVSERKYRRAQSQFLKNVKREGVVFYESRRSHEEVAKGGKDVENGRGRFR